MDIYIDGAVRLDVVERLKAQCPTANENVVDDQPGEVQEHQYPGIFIAPYDTIVEIDGVAGRRIEIQPVQIKILILARDEAEAGGRSADQVAEQIAIEVRAAMKREAPSRFGVGALPDPVFPRSTPSDVRLLRSQRLPDENSPYGMHHKGALLLTYQFKVATPEGEAAVALDLA